MVDKVRVNSRYLSGMAVPFTEIGPGMVNMLSVTGIGQPGCIPWGVSEEHLVLHLDPRGES